MKELHLLLLLLLLPALLFGQAFVPNYDESKVGSYHLPDPLLMPNGQKINTTKTWQKHRSYWLNQFSQEVYGLTPQKKITLRFELVESKPVMDGAAIRKRVNIYFEPFPQVPPIELLLYLPTRAKGKTPVALGLNFCGNHGTTLDDDLPISLRWARPADDGSVVNNQFTEKSRGKQASRWPAKKLIQNGMAMATVYYGDIEPDHPNGWRVGIRSALGDTTQPNNWGAIGAWAWGISRMMDYLATEPSIDLKRSFLTGHSRLGKAALWAAAQDQRIAAVNANCSGEGGAALTRRIFGETTTRINAVFPHWFCQNYRKYNDNASALPVDQHILLALIAPRPLYVASADEDLWADPLGEFLSLKATEPIYALYGTPGLDIQSLPAANQAHGGRLSYHLRQGKHDITAFDWQQYIQFIQQNLR
jgi:hypothetical protein